MVRRWVCGVVVVVILGSLGWSAPAMAKQPADYYGAEFLYAEGGAILLGTLGLPSAFNGTWQGQWIWGMTRAFGAGLGVLSAGGAYGVQGNVVMAFVLPGVLLSIGPIRVLLNEATDEPVNIVDALIVDALYVPFLPAILAVIGFNIGAKMKDTGQPASLPWTLDLPVLSLEF